MLLNFRWADMEIEKFSFAGRLRECMSKGMLSISDLSIWLGRSRPAVNTWVKGRIPLTIYAHELQDRLQKLESLIEQQEGKPLVPHTVSMRTRKTYLLGLLDAALTFRPIPEPNTSKPRVAVRLHSAGKKARLGKDAGGTEQ